LAPSFFAQVFPAKTVSFPKKQSVELLARLKLAPGAGAGVGSMFDRPFVG
jgi:hypothetical protein